MADTLIKVNVGDLFRVDHAVAAGSEGLYVEGVKVVGTQEAFVADVTPAADGTTAGTAVNSILAILVAHGLMAAS